jgi:chitinase
MRRDSNNTSIRTDFSNVQGYWPWLVDSPGDSGTDTTDKRDLIERYYSSSTKNWKNRYYESSNNFSATLGSPIKIKEDISAPVFWQGTSECLIDGEEYGEGFGAFVEGTIDAQILFGWSMIITTQFYGDFEVKEADGFLTVDGTSDLTYGIAGMGNIDITRYNKGNPAFSPKETFNLQGDTVSSGQMGAFMTFNPYVTINYQMATLNTTGDNQFSSDPKVAFNGRLTTRVLTDLGDVTAYWPSPTQDEITADYEGRASNKISSGTHNVIFQAPGSGGRIGLGTYIRFGMGIEFSMPFNTMEGDTRSIDRKADVSTPDKAFCVLLTVRRSV